MMSLYDVFDNSVLLVLLQKCSLLTLWIKWNNDSRTSLAGVLTIPLKY